MIVVVVVYHHHHIGRILLHPRDGLSPPRATVCNWFASSGLNFNMVFSTGTK